MRPSSIDRPRSARQSADASLFTPSASRLVTLFYSDLDELGHVHDDTRRADLARVAVQLSATAFEIGFLTAATDESPPEAAP